MNRGCFTIWINKSTILLFVVIITFASCKSKKEIVTIRAKNISKNKLLNNIEVNEKNFDTFSAKINTNINYQNNNYSLKGNIRIKKDSVIWISLSPALGIEMLRISISKDSIKYINRLDMAYFVGSYDNIEKLLNLPIDYYSLESLLLNFYLLHAINNDDFNIRKAKLKNIDDYYLLESKNQRLTKKVNNEISDSYLLSKFHIQSGTFIINHTELSDVFNDRKLKIDYNNFEEIKDNVISKNIEIHTNTEKNDFDINLTFSKIQLDTKTRFNFKISDKYKPIEF